MAHLIIQCSLHFLVTITTYIYLRTSLVAQQVKNLPAMQNMPVQFLHQEDPLEDRLPTPVFLGFHGGSGGKESTHNAGFYPWVEKTPWRRAWQSTPVFLPGESPRMEELGRLQSMGSQRVGHDWVTKYSTKNIPVSSGRALRIEKSLG